MKIPGHGHLSVRDWERIDRALRGLYADGLSAGTFVFRALEALKLLVPGEFSTYTRAHRRGARAGAFDLVLSDDNRLDLATMLAFVRLKDGYELWNSDVRVRHGRPLFLHDYFSAREFRQSDMYAEAYRRAGLDNHCAIPLMEEDGTGVFLSVQRRGGADFSERERVLLMVLQPHLRSARALTRHRAEAGELRMEHFSGFGLTPRETEVFFWLVEGKRNSEIAAILRIRLDTTKAHVSRIFQKLRVENRHAAIRLGLEASRQTARDELRPHAAGRKAFFIPGAG